MQAFLSPGIKLLGRFGFARKFQLLFLLFILPLAGSLHEFYIAGIWRDYARSSGSIQMPLDAYRAITQDMDVSDAAIWLAKGSSAASLPPTRPTTLPRPITPCLAAT